MLNLPTYELTAMQFPAALDDGTAHMTAYVEVDRVRVSIAPGDQQAVWNEADLYIAAKNRLDKNPPGFHGSGWITQIHSVSLSHIV